MCGLLRRYACKMFYMLIVFNQGVKACILSISIIVRCAAHYEHEVCMVGATLQRSFCTCVLRSLSLAVCAVTSIARTEFRGPRLASRLQFQFQHSSHNLATVVMLLKDFKLSRNNSARCLGSRSGAQCSCLATSAS